ncbi:DNA cytosine methyltransferase [Phaeodactylibacter luteus]|uniref:DNA (cytosine-5-)-methyltransferase n=1 Tax=Phaeodactylibacter luteus TaxID=1564516 RepID=A0A5C6RJJ6_9BACT|nr:DNA cytosine methyltransferase [Phaeodactylibacter luteus]TXB62079.1 DNA cytosine methyltransferase [Phaeodactylibacter luteus]
MRIASFFAGAGGLDLGFQRAGFDVIWANEYDRDIWETYAKNHPHTHLEKRSITAIDPTEIPDCDGMIGGPPCQSWSTAGKLRGINDNRGKLFYDFIRILEEKQPKFFLAENVAGMLLPRNSEALNSIKKLFKNAGAGYDLSFQLINARDYLVPQDRKRVFFIGYRRDLGQRFEFPEPIDMKLSLKSAIGDLQDLAIPARDGNYTNGRACRVPNHEYFTGGFSSLYMSRNRVRSWDEVSFTIQASGRHAPLHPQAPKMEAVDKETRRFAKGSEHLYRRLSVREVARIQTFPDDFIFYYKNLAAAYKMIGNAVPVRLAQVIASKIMADFG